jgi:phosphomannomutase
MAPKPIAFGTSGWRGILGDDFTFFNLRRATRAVARLVHEENRRRAPILFVGYDTRFLSEQLARDVASVLLSEGVRPRLAADFVPTPVVAHAIRRGRLDGGINLTASHNPSEYNGFKFSTRDGAPAPPEATRRVEALIAEIPDGSPAPQARPSELRTVDPSRPYRAAVLRIIDRKAIGRGRLRLVCDPLYGAGRGYSQALLSPVARVTTIRDRRDVRFGGRGPDPNEKYLDELCAEVRRTGAHLGLATDGDADRFGIVDRGGHYIAANLILALLADYLLETRGYRSGVARTVATTHLLDDVAQHHGVAHFETPVGFKYFRDLLLDGKVFLAGEESSGLSVSGHVPEKDGILAGCLVAEMVARRRASLRRQIQLLFRKVGPRHSARRDFRMGPGEVIALRRRLESPPGSLAGKRVIEVRTTDGTLMLLQDASWLLLRPSGTEPLVRCYAEARSPKDLTRLLDAGRSLVLNP